MKSKKKFDAVEMMRQLRDNLSKELSGKSFEEQKKILKSKIESEDLNSSTKNRIKRKTNIKV